MFQAPVLAQIWEDTDNMKQTLFTTAAVIALSAGTASAADLVFTPGEGPFSWDSYNAWAETAPDLSGQTITIGGPWLQPEDGYFRSRSISRTKGSCR